MAASVSHAKARLARRHLALIGASSVIALTTATSAFAQAGANVGTATQNGSPDISAQNAAQPRDEAAQPGAGQVNQSPSGADSTDEIVVTGLRGSLQRNLDIKRSAPGVIDAISAEDIGKFPDSNLAASLQRLPGVSIQRDGARGEPTGISVRGFSGAFNETLFDGRRVSTGNGTRAVNFSTIGSDFVGQLNVLKTPDVTVAANSIGATVNVLYPKPFDKPGFRFSVSASGAWQDGAKKVTPTAGFLISDTFADDTIGVLADFGYSRRDTRTNSAYINGFNFGLYAPCQLVGSTATTCNPTTNATTGGAPTPASQLRTVRGAFEQQYGLQQTYTRDKRIDARVAVQWHPSDNLMVTIDDTFNKQTLNQNSFGIGIWFNQNALRNVQLDSNGVPLNFNQAGSQTDFVANVTKDILMTNVAGFNVKWDVSENFSIEADADYAFSWRNPNGQTNSENGDVGYGFAIGPNLGIVINGDSKNTIPSLNVYGPNGDRSRFTDTSVFGSHVMTRTANRNTDEIKQGRLTAQWKQDHFQIRVGGQYTEEEFRLRTRNAQDNNYWQAYSGYGPASTAPGAAVSGVPVPGSLFTNRVSTKNWLPGYSGELVPELINYSPFDVQNYLRGLGNPQTTRIPGFAYTTPIVGTGFTGTYDLVLSPGLQNIKEKTGAIFVRASYDNEIAGMPFFFNAGLREEITHLTSGGLGRVPISIALSPGDPTLFVTTFTPTQPVSTKSNYHYLLPSVDMKLNVTEKFDLRFSASRTLTRPALNLLTPVLNVAAGPRVGALTATGGNPALKPYLSENFDVAAEWYYRRNSYIAVDLFLKGVSNFIVQGTQRQSINGVVDPTTGSLAQYNVSQQINGPNATVKGIEAAWQHVFGDTGFGFQANGTYVTTNRKYDPNNFTVGLFAVTGLANSANFVGFYDKNGFQIRAALNYRDKYLLQFGQAQNTGSFGSEPTFVNSQLQLDVSTSWDVTKNVNVFAEVLNLNNSTYSTHGRFSNQLLSAFAYGRRVTAGARVRF